MSTALDSAVLVEVGQPPQPPIAASDDAIYRILVAVSSLAPKLDYNIFVGLNWDALLAQARHHSLLPLVAHRLLESRNVVLPAQLRARLRSEFQANLLRNFGLFEETKRILRVWREAGIEAIPYKGPVLAEQLWGSFALRDCSDLDFLVRRSNVECAGEALTTAGYIPVAPVAPALRRALLRDASEEQFRHSQSKLLLELQWAPIPRTLAVSFDADAMWHRIRRAEVAVEAVNAPSPDDLFALLAIHGWKHNWSKLIWIADLAALMSKYPFDWKAIYESATKQGWRRILLLAVEMVSRVYGIKCELLRYVDPPLRVLAERIEQNLRLARDNRYLEWHRDMLAARDSRSWRLRQIANFIFIPGLAEYASARLQPWMSPAYRVIRVARVIGLFWEKAFQ
jgi:hypothetical protein